MKVVIISDIHFDRAEALPDASRCGALADILFLRAVHRVNRMLRPDVTVLLGDLVDGGDAPSAIDCLQRLREIAELIEGPVIAIPGNHDPRPDTFYSIFERPEPFLDVKGVRLVSFVDQEAPEYNATREQHDLRRMAEARSRFDGPIVTLQHVPLFPLGASDCPYNYTNADAIISAMHKYGIGLAVSGHYHRGMDLIRTEGAGFLANPALCESPFRFTEIDIEDDVRVTTHALRMPEELELVDLHVHTQFAYCSENMEITRAMALGDQFGMSGLGFAEHSGHLYFNKPIYWDESYLPTGIEFAKKQDDRVDEYLAATAAADCPPEWVGLEVDCDFQGRAIVHAWDRGRVKFLMGAMHVLRSLRQDRYDEQAACEDFLGTLERLLQEGIHILAHPFRVFQRSGLEPPQSLFEPTVRLLRQHGVAAEINLHTNTPRVPFVRRCLEEGVKLTLGSDAHNLYEVGELAPHLEILRACGFDGELKDILFDPRE